MIYKNALEYNPVDVPRSREIRERAFEFCDATEMLLDENSTLTDLGEKVTEVSLLRKLKKKTILAIELI